MLAGLLLAGTLAWGVETLTETPPFVVRSWQTRDGLPQNSAQALADTEEGYLWVGTKGGLARFDGVRFRAFGLSDGLKSLNVMALAADGTDGLWIGTVGGGLSRWRAGGITTLTMADGLAHNDVMALAPDGHGGVWVGSKGGLQHWGADGFTPVGEADGLIGEVVALAPKPGGGVWVTMDENGLFFCHEGRCERVEGPPDFPRFHGYSLLVDRDGDLWVSIGNGMVLRRHGSEWTTFSQTHGLPYSFIYCLAEGPAGEVWAGSHEAGLYVFRDGHFDPLAGTDNAIRALHRGRDGVLWAGTQTGGLSRLTPRKVTEYVVGQESHRGQVNGVVEEAPGQFAVGTYGGGLYRGTWKALSREAGDQILEDRPFFSAGLKMSDGRLVFAGARVLAQRPPNTTGFQLLDTENVSALCEHADGSLLYGTREGALKRLTPEAKVVLETKFAAPISGLLRGPGASVWVATQGAGLHQWDAGNVRRWTTADGLPTDILRALHADAEGTLWIGTVGGGLAWLRDGRFHSVNSQQGLGDDVVSQVLEDDDGHLWLGCNRGIFRVSKQELHGVAGGSVDAVHPLALDEADGMLVPECTGGYAPAGLRSSSGMLYFSTVRGVVAVNPLEFATFTKAPPVLIEEVLRNGKAISTGPQPLVLDPGVRSLEIRFTAFNSLKPEQIRFRYRLGKGREEWVELNQKRFVNISHLEAGDYRFEVSAANQDGHWSASTASLPFKVLPYFWETGAFRVAMVFAVMASGATLVFALARGKIRRAVAKERLAKAEAEARHHLNELGHLSRVALVSEMGTSLAHELNQPLTAILSNANAAERYLARGTMDPQELREILADIARDGSRAGDVIHGIREMVRKDHGGRHAVDVNEFVSHVLRLVRADALAHGCTLATDLAPGLPPAVGDAVQLQQVLLNLIVNAFDAMGKANSGRSRVEIASRLADAATVEVSVRDFGPGLPVEEPARVFERFYSTKTNGMGMGLSIARSIIEAHSGTLTAENVAGGGARFSFRLPVMGTVKQDGA